MRYEAADELPDVETLLAADAIRFANQLNAWIEVEDGQIAGWASLTGTERTVAMLLAEGLSNPDIAARMFISRRTVQFHVSNILAKLGLSSRVELAALVARRAG